VNPTRSILATLAVLWMGLLAGCASVPAGAPGAVVQQAMREHPERLIVVAVANPKASASVVAGSTAAGYATLQPYLGGTHARQAIDALKRSHGLTELVAWPIQALRLHCAVLELPAGVARDEFVRSLARDPRFEIVQPLHSFDTLSRSDALYNDPYASLQRGLAEIEAAPAHLGSRGQGVSVAIIDTGVDASHPDLLGRVASARNLVDRDAAQFGRDRHGTEVAGVIAAVANNRVGIVGIAPEATLKVYKACWQREAGAARCNSFTLAQALAAGLDDGARVINLSLAGPSDELLARLLRQAIAQGRIVVGAVPADGALDGFPLGVAGVIAVDSTGRPDRGGVLKAPGHDILTLAPGGHYDFRSGSSLAAAHVSGVVALLLALPDAPRPAAVQALLESSRLRADGSGSISACGAIAALRRMPGCNSLAR
jgi:subtilisin family serine protease